MRIILRTFFIIALCGTSQLSIAQIISSISIQGNERSKEDFILQWMDTKVGDSLNQEILDEDIRFLKNLSVFSSVTYSLVYAYHEASMNDVVAITIELEESLAILPIIGIGGIQENINIQLGVSDYNVAGRSGQAAVIYSYYDRHSFQAFLHQRYIGKSAFGTFLNVERRATLEPVYVDTFSTDYLTDRWVIEAMPGFHFTRFFYVQAGGAWLSEGYEAVYPDLLEEIGLPETVSTTKWLTKIVATVDRRMYQRQYVEGWSIQLFLEHISSPYDEVPFNKVFSETKWYLQGGQGNYAGRLRLGMATNSFSPFPPFVIDSYVNIRGSGNRIARGTAELVLNQEYRYTIQEKKWGAVQVVGFSDLGFWRPAGETFTDMFSQNNIAWFTGAGARIYVARFYQLFLRADFGISPLDAGKNGFVLGIGQYF